MYDVVVLRFSMHVNQRGVRWAGSARIGYCATLGIALHAWETVSDDKYANIRSIIDNGKPRHLRPILSV